MFDLNMMAGYYEQEECTSYDGLESTDNILCWKCFSSFLNCKVAGSYSIKSSHWFWKALGFFDEVKYKWNIEEIIYIVISNQSCTVFMSSKRKTLTATDKIHLYYYKKNKKQKLYRPVLNNNKKAFTIFLLRGPSIICSMVSIMSRHAWTECSLGHMFVWKAGIHPTHLSFPLDWPVSSSYTGHPSCVLCRANSFLDFIFCLTKQRIYSIWHILCLADKEYLEYFC